MKKIINEKGLIQIEYPLLACLVVSSTAGFFFSFPVSLCLSWSLITLSILAGAHNTLKHLFDKSLGHFIESVFKKGINETLNGYSPNSTDLVTQKAIQKEVTNKMGDGIKIFRNETEQIGLSQSLSRLFQSMPRTKDDLDSIGKQIFRETIRNMSLSTMLSMMTADGSFFGFGGSSKLELNMNDCVGAVLKDPAISTEAIDLSRRGRGVLEPAFFGAYGRQDGKKPSNDRSYGSWGSRG